MFALGLLLLGGHSHQLGHGVQLHQDAVLLLLAFCDAGLNHTVAARATISSLATWIQIIGGGGGRADGGGSAVGRDAGCGGAIVCA